MDLGLNGRSLLVTGGTRGIGRAIALAYAADGARVAITYATDPAAAQRCKEEIEAYGTPGLAVRLDLYDPSSIDAAMADTVAAFGGLDVLIANAVRWHWTLANRSPTPTRTRGSTRWRQTWKAPWPPSAGRFHI